MASIKIAGITDDSIVDGEGYRFTIFVQGCPHHCPGCHNPQTHDKNGGTWADTEDLYKQIVANPLLSGVTFSGGEPFCQAGPLAELALALHKRHLDIWTYTGYTLEELEAQQNLDVQALLNETDVLVDGPFILEQRDLTLPFRGSQNQRLIDMVETRKQKKLVLKQVETDW